ncbi:siderophore-interacting protein [Kutzneria viridogrisea]|uniref:NADPH-dependent ferric siderophore reductase n=1 Tax=Kutzneria viridogrisea TaxID=47990 RepID=A0ABR6BYG7_9PSEU|nr:NADPH-dependent ferric siderophore reductase [Kutzneria viridogrisea]
MHSISAGIRRVMARRGHQVLTCPVTFVGSRQISANYHRVTLRGEGLRGYRDPLPGDAFKLALPAVRCYTVQSFDPDSATLEFDLFVRPQGFGARWLRTARPGEELSLTGMRVDFHRVPDAHHLVIADTAGIPAAATILRSCARAEAVARADPGDRGLLPERTRWASGALLDAVRPPDPGTQVWIGAEHAVAQQIRKYLLHECAVPQENLHASPYWTSGLDWERTFAESMRRFTDAAAAGLDTGDPLLLQSLAFE